MVTRALFRLRPVGIILSALLLCAIPLKATDSEEDDLMAFETIVQGVTTGDYVMALPVGRDLFLTVYDFARTAGFVMDDGSSSSGFWGSASRKFSFDAEGGYAKFGPNTLKIQAADVMRGDGDFYYSPDFFQKLFGIRIEFDKRQMTMAMEADEPLPVAKLRELQRKSARGRPLARESFKEFDFDNRLFTAPVVDLSLTKSWAKNGQSGRTSQSDAYAVDAGMILGGLDSNFHIFGSSNADDRAPRARMLFSRIFMEEPGNMINLRRFEAGDIVGSNSGFFTRGSNGRGAQISSFKNMVTAADKTITITGVLADGWEAELYLNDQLVSFRQPSFNGRYEFPNIPVSFGLNNFRVVLYGPQGEIVFEEKRYWSGSSPVSAGELGYSIAAYQQDRFVVEANESRIKGADNLTFDSNFFYGLGDRLTLLTGFTSAPGVVNEDEMRQFGMAGLQYISQGFSTQYNTLYGFDNEAVGHHFDIQGDIMIANILARYEYYGDLESPQAYYNDGFLKDLAELRLTGFLPLYIMKLPWFFSIRNMNAHSGENVVNTNVRISPNMYGFFTSIDYSRDQSSFSDGARERVAVAVSRTLAGSVSAGANWIYLIRPEAYWSSANLNLNYRLDRNTFLTGQISVTNRSAYSDRDNLYAFSVSAGRAFPFGSLTLRVGTDTDNNVSTSLNYRISFAKNPHKNALITNPETAFTRRAAVAVKAVDTEGNPVSGVAVRGAGGFKPKITGDDGIAVITDMPTYAKTYIFTEAEDIEDVSLTPDKEKYKQVLRPGTMLPLIIGFTQKGEVEGQVKLKVMPEGNRKPALNGFAVQLRDTSGNIVMQTYTDQEGFFVLEQAPFGHYEVAVLRDGFDAVVREVHLNDAIVSINEPLEI